MKRLLFAALILHTLGARGDGPMQAAQGFGVDRGVVDGVALCQMFNRRSARPQPHPLGSSDPDERPERSELARS